MNFQHILANLRKEIQRHISKYVGNSLHPEMKGDLATTYV